MPSQTSYCAASLTTVPYVHEDAAALLLLGQALTTKVLHREIREKGGAYGGGAGANPRCGTFGFNSYRDPQGPKTLEVRSAGCRISFQLSAFVSI